MKKNNTEFLSGYKRQKSVLPVCAVLTLVLLFLLASCGDGSAADAEHTPAAAAAETPVPVETVCLGAEEYPSDSERIAPEGVSFDELVVALESFPSLKELDVSRLELTNEQLHILSDTASGIELVYSVQVLGKKYPSDTASLDLSEMTAADAESVAAALGLFTGLETASLPPSGGDLSGELEAIALLQAASPLTDFEYSFTLYGKHLSLSDTEVIYTDKDIGNDGVAVFYGLIPCMKRLERLVLDDCGTDDETMAALNEAFPEVSVVWRVHWNQFSVLTDTKVIRATGTKTDNGIDSLKYCTQVRFMDLGHSKKMYDIEFTRYMPHLQILIIADAAVETIEPLSECTELMMLEITNCFQLDDISPLANCKALRYLNLSNTYKIKDMSPIFDLPDLERVYASRYGVPEEQVDRLRELHPDCWVAFGMPEESSVSCNYSVGWRLDEAPNVRAEWYVEMRKIFGIGYDLYDSQGAFSYKNVKPYEIPYDELKIFLPAES